MYNLVAVKSDTKDKAEEARMEKIRLMIVDDNRGFVEVLSQHFKNIEDVEVVGTARDGAEAISFMESMSPDVVLLDMVMPKLDGMGVLEHVFQSPTFQNQPKPKFIMISSFAQEMMIQKAMLLGASYFMIKPFDLITLTQRIRTVANEGRLYILQESYAESYATGTTGPAYSYAPVFAPKEKTLTKEQEESKKEVNVTRLMLEIGVPANIRGYQYLRDGIMIAVDNPQVINAITKVLYPCIAKNYETTPSRVERAMRHAIEVAWNRGKVDVFHQVFGYSINTRKGKPTNGEFIAMIADRVRLKMC